MPGRLAPEGDLAPIDPVHTGIATWRRSARNDGRARYEAQLHQTKRHILRKVQRLHHPGFPLPQVGEGEGQAPVAVSPAIAAAPPTPSSEPTSRSHQVKHLVENHFHPQTISKVDQDGSRRPGLRHP